MGRSASPSHADAQLASSEPSTAEAAPDVLSTAPDSENLARGLSVGVAVDREFQRTPEWKALLETEIASASAVLAREFRMELKIVGWAEWNSGEAVSSAQQLYDRALTVHSSGEIVLVVSGKSLPWGDDGTPPPCGVARYFQKTALVCCADELSQMYLSETILHEIGHLFGAWHSSDDRSVMRRHPVGESASWFDPEARAVLSRFRRIDLLVGVDGLTGRDMEFITGEYRKRHIPGEMHPVAHCLARRAMDQLKAGELAGAERAACLALEISRAATTDDRDGANELSSLIADIRRRALDSKQEREPDRDER